MKAYYEAAGIPVARYHIVDNEKGCKAFIKKVGYPVIVKPDNGVGASSTYKFNSDEDLKFFLENQREANVSYIMEEFIQAEVTSYDAIIDSNGKPIFEASNVTPLSLMEVVNNSYDSIYYIQKSVPADVKKAGRATVKSFGVKSRFVHFEFFRLTADQEIGQKGDIVALEVNMRPSGGNSPDMFNFANSTNVYKIWADMIAFDKSEKEVGEHFYCAFLGRRDAKEYEVSLEELRGKYAANIKMDQRVPDALSGAMGNHMLLLNFSTKKEMENFYKEAMKAK